MHPFLGTNGSDPEESAEAHETRAAEEDPPLNDQGLEEGAAFSGPDGRRRRHLVCFHHFESCNKNDLIRKYGTRFVLQ